MERMGIKRREEHSTITSLSVFLVEYDSYILKFLKPDGNWLNVWEINTFKSMENGRWTAHGFSINNQIIKIVHILPYQFTGSIFTFPAGI